MPVTATSSFTITITPTGGNANGIYTFTRAAAGVVDYDATDNGLIDISTPAQLNAVRHDLKGQGPAKDVSAAYDGAFPNRPTYGMGCAEGCRGYELLGNLNLDELQQLGSHWRGDGQCHCALRCRLCRQRLPH